MDTAEQVRCAPILCGLDASDVFHLLGREQKPFTFRAAMGETIMERQFGCSHVSSRKGMNQLSRERQCGAYLRDSLCQLLCDADLMIAIGSQQIDKARFMSSLLPWRCIGFSRRLASWLRWSLGFNLFSIGAAIFSHFFPVGFAPLFALLLNDWRLQVHGLQALPYPSCFLESFPN
jgi:hypothetical protein